MKFLHWGNFWLVILCHILFFGCHVADDKPSSRQPDEGPYQLALSLKGGAFKKAAILAFFGDRQLPVDSLALDSIGIAHFTFAAHHWPGLYALVFEDGQTIRLVYNGRENIAITSDWSNMVDSLKVLQSAENKLYYRYFRDYGRLARQAAMLAPLVREYPPNSSFYAHLRQEYDLVTAKAQQLFGEVSATDTSWAGQYLNAIHQPIHNPHFSPEELKTYLKKHFLDRRNFDIPALRYSDAYASIAVDYLSLFRDGSLNRQEQHEAFRTAADTLMQRAVNSPEVSAFLADYLVEGFDAFGYQELAYYISNKYGGVEHCQTAQNAEKKPDMETPFSLLGKKAPSFRLPGLHDSQVSSTVLEEELSLLIFWSGKCQHCLNALDQLQDLRGLTCQVVAINLDTDKEEWSALIATMPDHWKHCYVPESLYNDVVPKYGVKATPTFFLVSPQGSVLRKSNRLDDLLTHLI